MAYGDFILQFKYTLDIIDRMDLGFIARPRFVLLPFPQTRSRLTGGMAAA
jgi:hypothetical protein